MLRSRHWLSSVIKRDKDVSNALAEISDQIHAYADAGSPVHDDTLEASSQHLVLQRYESSRKCKLPADDPREMELLLGGHRYGCQYDFED